MNRENVLKVADAIEQHSIPDLGFNMSQWVGRDGEYSDRSGHQCQTTACIAGWAAAVATGKTMAPNGPYDFGATDGAGYRKAAVTIAREFMGLTQDHLFWGGNGYTTPLKAVAVLRHLAETGEVDWSVADTVKP